MNESSNRYSNIEKELDLHGTVASTTSGTSMRPLFSSRRDMVVIERPKGELKKYDVALYRDSVGKHILHRVIRVKEDEYLIRGDNTFVLERVKKDRIIGVLTCFNRKGKHYSADDKGYLLYAKIWNFIYPVRFVINAVRRFCITVLVGIKHLLFGKGKKENNRKTNKKG